MAMAYLPDHMAGQIAQANFRFPDLSQMKMA